MQMQISEGQLAAWEITAAVLQELDDGELELLPDIAESVHAPGGRIGGVPGAFDFDFATVNSIAIAVFGAAAMTLKETAPKLFEAALDLGKDAIKKIVEKRLGGTRSKAVAGAADPKRIHDIVRRAALDRRLSEAGARAIADAVVAQLAIQQAKTKRA
jgi:hypothetical protein